MLLAVGVVILVVLLVVFHKEVRFLGTWGLVIGVLWASWQAWRHTQDWRALVPIACFVAPIVIGLAHTAWQKAQHKGGR